MYKKQLNNNRFPPSPQASPAYKRRRDLPSDRAYADYVVATAREGMTVRLTTGRYLGLQPGGAGGLGLRGSGWGRFHF